MTIPIRGPSWSTPLYAFDVAVERGARRHDFLREYLDALYADAATVGIRADVLVAQADLETASFTSTYWTRDGNPAGLAAFDDGSNWGLTFTPAKAARAHVTHMCAYLGINVSELGLEAWKATDARWDAVIVADYFCTVSTTAHLGNGRWATDPNYGSKIEQRHAAYSFTPPKEGIDMAGYTITWPGLPGGPITFSFPVSTDRIVPAWRTLQRPGIKARRPRRAVQHSNGNPSALARQDTQYLYDGAGGRQASWHGTVDHKRGDVNLPADEVGWHAGDGAGPGNYNGFAVEISEYPFYNLSTTEANQAQDNGAEMMGRVAARLEIADPDFHADYMLKNCPRIILGNATRMKRYTDKFWHFYNDEKARMTGTPSTPAARLKVGDYFEITADAVNIRQGWGTTARLVSTLLKGAKGTIIDGPQSANGYTWWDVRVDGFGTGWIAEGTASEAWLTKTAAPAPPPKPEPKPEYAAKSPVPELLETNMKFADLYNTSAGVTTINELDFIFVADVVEFKRTSPALQYGVTGSKEVGPPYQEGDRVIAAWLVKGTDGLYYYLLTGGDDEWVRVKYIDTVRVADAPLIPMPNDTHVAEALVTTLENALDK